MTGVWRREGYSGEDDPGKKSMKKGMKAGNCQVLSVQKALWTTVGLPALEELHLGEDAGVKEMKYKKNILNKYPSYFPWSEIGG